MGPAACHGRKRARTVPASKEQSLINYQSSWNSREIDIFREAVRRFIEAEFLPLDKTWQRQQYVDKAAWRQAGEIGLLCPDVPPEYGGAGGNFCYDAVVYEELAFAGITSFGNAIQSIVAHYLLAYGNEEQKRSWLPKLVSGEMIAAIAMSEPQTGSDLQGVKTRAELQGRHYVINGSKTFISNGQTANLICVVAKTDQSQGTGGITLIMVESEGLDGLRRGRTLEKLGQKGQDTSELFFDDCRVPAENLLGETENRGFTQLMQQLPRERLIVAIMGVAAIERALRLTVEYTKERKAFGQSIADFQNTRFRLAECQTEAVIGRIFVDHCIERLNEDKLDSVTASMAKWWVTEKQCEIIDQCVQLHGGYGYMLEYPIAQMYADCRPQRIYAGTNEIMKELIAKSLWERPGE